LRGLLTFLFGEPGWFGWYVALWLSLLPGIYLWWWLRTTTPGAGPQGGLVAFLGLMLLLAALTLIGLALAIRYAGTAATLGPGRYVVVIGTWLIGWGIVAWKLSSWANTASLADATVTQRFQARTGFLLLLLATAAAHLWVLAKIRQAARLP
jgi:hypothetical protein